MNSSSSQSTARPVAAIVPSIRAIEGGGFEVFRPFPTSTLDMVDPFLLLDEMGPQTHEPGGFAGAPDHPHRGFETVTYIIDGEVEHRDSAGNHGVIGPGDVQWMTAGDGIVHSEMPGERLQLEGGHMHGLQVWVNLPQRLKRTTPRYQGLPEDQIPTASGDGWRAHVVAGSMFGVEGPAETHTPVGYARVILRPGAEVRIPVAADHTALVYPVAGDAVVGDQLEPLSAHQLAVFDRSAGDIVVAVSPDASADLDAIVLTGQPINEPVARYGPFVMNTRDELQEAVEDFNAGRMGTIPAVGTA